MAFLPYVVILPSGRSLRLAPTRFPTASIFPPLPPTRAVPVSRHPTRMAAALGCLLPLFVFVALPKVEVAPLHHGYSIKKIGSLRCVLPYDRLSRYISASKLGLERPVQARSYESEEDRLKKFVLPGGEEERLKVNMPKFQKCDNCIV